MQKLTVVARIVAKPEAVEQVKTEILKIIPATRKEAGCISYDLFRDNDHADAFVLIENWESAAHLAAHMETPHFQAAAAAIGGITEGIAVNKLSPLD